MSNGLHVLRDHDLQTIAVWFSVCAEYYLLIKQAATLATKVCNVDALSQIYPKEFLHIDYGSSGRSSDRKAQKGL